MQLSGCTQVHNNYFRRQCMQILEHLVQDEIKRNFNRIQLNEKKILNKLIEKILLQKQIRNKLIYVWE